MDIHVSYIQNFVVCILILEVIVHLTNSPQFPATN